MSFKVGQRVVCVDVSHSAWPGINPPLVRDTTYVVKAVRTCPACGSVVIDVGLFMPSIMSDYTRCSCGFRYQSGRLWWVRASRFRPIDDLHEQLERIEKEGAPAELHEAHAFQLLNKCTD